MLTSDSLSRRHFMLLAAAAAAAASPLLARGAENKEGYLKGRLYKTLKIGMVRTGTTLEEKFAIAKEAGFDGIELNTPGIDVEEVRAAIKATGLPVDGSVNSSHWQVRHTDADPVPANQHAKRAFVIGYFFRHGECKIRIIIQRIQPVRSDINTFPSFCLQMFNYFSF